MAPAPLRRSVVRLALLAIILTIARVPVLDHPVPVHADEVGFVAGLGFPSQYPVHHPGYPMWVALGTLTDAIGLGGYAGLQLWSVLASILAPIALYLGLRKILADGLTWWLALAFGFNPLVWFLSATALNYVAGAAVGLVVIGLCWRAIAERDRSALRWAAIVLAGGLFLRPDLLMWLGPMLAWAAWRHRARGGMAACAIVLVGLGALLGLTAYLYGRADVARPRPELSHTINTVLNTSVVRLGLVNGLGRNLVKLCANLAWDFGLSSLLLVVALVHWRRVSANRPDATRFMLLWTVPLVAFVLLIHMSEPGHIILLIPAGYCVMGLGLAESRTPRTATRLAAAAAVFSAVQFGFYPCSFDGDGIKPVVDRTIAYMSRSGLLQIDARRAAHTPGDFWRTRAHDTAPTLALPDTSAAPGAIAAPGTIVGPGAIVAPDAEGAADTADPASRPALHD